MSDPIERRKVRQRADRLEHRPLGWPKSAYYYDRHGRHWRIEIAHRNAEPTMQRLLNGKPVGEPETIKPDWGRAPHELEAPPAPPPELDEDEDAEPID